MPLAAAPYRASGLVLWRKAAIGTQTGSVTDKKKVESPLVGIGLGEGRLIIALSVRDALDRQTKWTARSPLAAQFRLTEIVCRKRPSMRADDGRFRISVCVVPNYAAGTKV